jgi:hypothetical protein
MTGTLTIDAAGRALNLTAGNLKVIGSIEVGTSTTLASGTNAIALGLGARATGNNSVSLGSGNTASSDYTFAAGNGCLASQNGAIALGGAAWATNQYSTAMGFNTSAGGMYSMVAGNMARTGYGGSFVWADSTAAYFTGTGPNQFLIRASNGVGINTASPGRFTVCTKEGAVPSIYVKLDGNVGIGTADPTGRFTVCTKEGATPSFFVKSDGNVGIGTTSPGYALDVNGDVNVASGKKYKINGTNLAASDVGAEPAITTLSVSKGGTGTGTLTGMLKGNATSAVSAINGTANYIPKWSDANTISGTSLIYDDSTNVGIGTMAPSQKLDVNGNVNITGNLTVTGSISATNITEKREVKAWVVFNGGSAVISDSYNVTSVSRTSAGVYVINWTTPFATANYALSGMANNGVMYEYSIATGSADIRVLDNDFSGAMRDSNYVSVIAIGDQ